MENINVSELLNKIGELSTVWGLKLLAALAIFIFGRIAAKLAGTLTEKALSKAKVDETLRPFVANLVHYTVLAFVVVATLGAVGIQTASIIAVLGAAGLAVGLAMQGTLANFAAGVMMMIFRPFRIGDFVETAGVAGVIRSIGIFVTELTSLDNVLITIPNGQIWGQIIKNYAANETRRNDIVIGVSYDDDLGQAKEAIMAVLKKDKRVLEDPAPLVEVSELGDSSVNFVVRPWCKGADYWALRFDLMRALKEGVEAAGCSFPYPQTDVHVHK